MTSDDTNRSGAGRSRHRDPGGLHSAGMGIPPAMNLSPSTALETLSDDVVPALASVADQTVDHLADLPSALGTFAAASSTRGWLLRGVTTVARRYPLAVGAAALIGGAAYLWRKRANKAGPKPLQFPRPEQVKDAPEDAAPKLVAPTTS
ncbi:MAG: hypothetical protein R2710_03380 [Acidimicrobiales bacterium]